MALRWPPPVCHASPSSRERKTPRAPDVGLMAHSRRPRLFSAYLKHHMQLQVQCGSRGWSPLEVAQRLLIKSPFISLFALNFLPLS